MIDVNSPVDIHLPFFGPYCRFGWIQSLFVLEAFIVVTSTIFWTIVLFEKADDMGYFPAIRNFQNIY